VILSVEMYDERGRHDTALIYELLYRHISGQPNNHTVKCTKNKAQIYIQHKKTLTEDQDIAD